MMTEWINVNDRMPRKDHQACCTHSLEYGVRIGIWYDWDTKYWMEEDRDCESRKCTDTITHWTEFPDPPPGK